MSKPQAQVRRFLFDNSFDAGRKPAKQPKPEDDKPPEPTFSQADVEQARQEAYEQGRLAGAAEAAAGTEAEVTRLLAGVAEALPAVAAAQEEANARLMRDGAALATAVVGKILPGLVARNGLDEIGALLDRCLRALIDQPKIMVRVAPQHAEALKARLAAAVQAGGFGGRFMIEADETLGPSDCRVSWPSGGLERNAEDVWRQVEAALAGYLEPRAGPDREVPGGTVEDADNAEER